MELTDTAASWPVVERRDIYRGHAIHVRADTITAPGHPEQFTRDVVGHVGAVGVLAVNDRDEILLVKQYRHPASALMVELPAGLKDTAGESALETARRELAEEGHVGARSWEPLLSISTSPGTSSEQVDIFLATDIEPDRQTADFEAAHEEATMERAWVPLDRVVDAVLDGRVKNALLVSGVLALVARRQRNTTV